jgi:hypothetical protein
MHGQYSAGREMDQDDFIGEYSDTACAPAQFCLSFLRAWLARAQESRKYCLDGRIKTSILRGSHVRE